MMKSAERDEGKQGKRTAPGVNHTQITCLGVVTDHFESRGSVTVS